VLAVFFEPHGRQISKTKAHGKRPQYVDLATTRFSAKRDRNPRPR
jgi:hypothetical protein